MSSTRTNKYWLRVKLTYVVLLVGFILALFVYALLPGSTDGAEVTLSTYPLRASILWAYIISSMVAIFQLPHAIYRDKKELSKDYSGVNQRHWITVGILLNLSGGLYYLWYLLARYWRTKNDTVSGGSIRDVGIRHIPLLGVAVSRLGQSLNTETRAEPPSQQPQPVDTNTVEPSAATASPEVSAMSAAKEAYESAESLRQDADAAREERKYDTSVEYYEEAVEQYQAALDSVSTHDVELIDTAEINEQIALVKDQKQQARQSHLTERVTSLQATYDKGDALANSGELEQARSVFQDVESSLVPLADSLSGDEFPDIRETIVSLKEQCQQRQAELTERLDAGGVPDTIPHVPDVSVEYTRLTEQEPIGSGGNADVTKARLPTPDEDMLLAIKEPRMSGTLHQDTVDQILTEAETWDKLDGHDHIVGLVDYGSDPLPWIAMEYMDAGHLGEQGSEMDIQQMLWTAIAVTKGVRHAHRRGVAHLDLKPENILFRSVDDAWNVPKVADWGLSKQLLDHSKSMKGLSPQYAAPEQFDESFGPVDDLTDIYQLGAVFYELFTGSPPFEGQPAKAMHKVLHEQPTPPSERASVPSELDEILGKSLAKEKTDRYDNVAYLRDALTELYASR